MSRRTIQRPEGTYKLDVHGTHFVTSLNGLVKGLAANVCTDETTCERITSTVGIDNLFVREGMDCVGLGILEIVSRNNYGALCAVSDDNDTRASCVDLGLRGQCLRDVNKILVCDTGCACP